MPRLTLNLLGAPRIELDGVPVDLDRRKAVALLAFLAVTGEAHGREALAALFWPEHDHVHARAALRRTLAALNAVLDGDRIEADREAVRLRLGAGLWVDASEFTARLAACRAHGHSAGVACDECVGPLAEAVDLYRGDFLAGFTLRDSPAFDDWQFFQTEALRGELAGALDRLVSWHSGAADYDRAVAYARRRLALDPSHEPAHARLMQLYAWSGQRAAALRQYHACARVLEHELGVVPQQETTRLFEAIHDGRALPPDRSETGAPADEPVAEDAPAAAGGARPGAPRVRDLPAQITSFLGREEELTVIANRLADPACRLLTLVGPGGIGKTQLALRAARDNGDRFRHGAVFISLTPVGSHDCLVFALMQGLGMAAYGPEEPRAQLFAYLREKHVLLVLDNFEHLIRGADLLTEVLAAARGVTLLVTSRERLSLNGEWTVEIQGLRYPEPGAAGRLLDYSAAQLFVESARRARADFALRKDEEPAVERICRLVEGMPLGLELAAAWVRMLSCEEIACEIEHGFDFLASSLRDVPERHRSIRAVFSHSWALLSDEEQAALRALSVFRGGFRREAAETVTGAPLAVLLGLVDKSLLRRNVYGRYDLHELVRQFVAEKLREDPAEEERARAAHGDFYTSFLHRIEADLVGDRPQGSLDEICSEFGNVREAWLWAIERARLADIEKSLTSLFSFYDIRGWFLDGDKALRVAEEELARIGGGEASEARERLRAKISARRGVFCSNLGQYARARALLESSLEAARRCGDRGEEAFCLNKLGKVVYHVGEHARAKRLLNESVALYQAIGNRLGAAEAMNVLGYVVGETGDYAEAKPLLEESLETLRQIGHRIRIASGLNNLGYILHLLGENGRAKELLQESLAMRRAVDHRVGIATTLANLGHVAEALDEHEDARDHFREALQRALEIHAFPIVLDVLAAVGAALTRKGREEAAVELVSLVHHHPLTWEETKNKTLSLLAGAEPKLSRGVFEAAVERGKLRRCEEAAEEVLTLAFWMADGDAGTMPTLGSHSTI